MSTRSELAIEFITPNLSYFLDELKKRNEDWFIAFTDADSFREDKSPNYLYYWESIKAGDLEIVIRLLKDYRIHHYVICVTEGGFEYFGDQDISVYGLSSVASLEFEGKPV